MTDSNTILQGNDGAAVQAGISPQAFYFCKSRLISILKLVNWNIDRPSRPADALILANGLVRDVYPLVAPSAETPENDPPSLAAMKAGLAQQPANPIAADLEACVSLLLRPWRDWKPDQQMRLAEQMAVKLAAVVSGLGAAAFGNPDFQGEQGAGANYTRFAIAAAAIVAVVAGGWWTFGTETAPRYYATRMADLNTIQAALEKYRQRNGAYPMSAKNGAEWNGIGWNGTAENWIPGIVPDYLPALPRDPRKTANPYQQYSYRSDGKDYKLIVRVSEDCDYVIDKYPEMADLIQNNWRLQKSFAIIPGANAPVHVCNAYGFWTKNGKDW